MKADLTRLTFDQTKHYRAVQLQQGRVQLDSDWNEQSDIAAHRIESETIDVVGTCGAPLHNDGFRLVASAASLSVDEAARAENKTPPVVGAGDLLITGGRFYAGGVLAENDRICLASAQPDLPTTADTTKVGGTPVFPLKPGTYFAYLDVWPRLRTAIDDPHIREVALGGPDTATRTKNAWQVKFLAAPDGANCSTSVAAWEALLNPKPGTLAASVAATASKPGPCIVDPGSGYRRLENQLYRVEVHTSGETLAKATFKWSRDNGAIVSRWLGQSALGEISVETTGRDKVLNLAAAHWIELTDDAHEELGLPGVFAQIASVNGTVLTLSSPTAAMDFANFPKNPKVRRWESAPATPGKWITPDGTSVSLNTVDTFELEDGVVVEFGPGSFRTGDYWLIPARTALPQVDWPTTGPVNAPVPTLLPPHGIGHHYCKLAVVEFAGGVFKITDCRSLFPPLTELTELFYVSGDSQEATPNPTLPATTLLPLALPLKVGVANGEWPVAGARVRFTVKVGGGTLTPATGIVLTGADGIASCAWSINSTAPNPEVLAELLDSADTRVGLPVIFHARLNTAKLVSYDPANCEDMKNHAPPIITVQDALDFLCHEEADVDCCVTIGKLGDRPGDYQTVAEALDDLLIKRKEKSICLNLLPGDHLIEPELLIESKGLCFKIAGCSHASRLVVNQPFHLHNLATAVIRDISILVQDSHIEFAGCEEVEVSNCVVNGRSTDSALVRIGQSQRAVITGNKMRASGAPKASAPASIFKGMAALAQAFALVDENDFRAQVAAVAKDLAELSRPQRVKFAGTLRTSVQSVVAALSPAERKAYTQLITTLATDNPTASTFTNRFATIRVVGAAAASTEGVALTLLDPTAIATIADNVIDGLVSLGGPAVPLSLTAADLKILKGKGVSFTSAGVLQVRANVLRQISADRASMDALRKSLDGNTAPIPIVTWSSAHFTDNVLVQGQNFFIAQHLSLNTTRFRETNQDLGVAVARSAVYVGNSDDNDVRLFSLTTTNLAQAANLGLNIVVI